MEDTFTVVTDLAVYSALQERVSIKRSTATDKGKIVLLGKATSSVSKYLLILTAKK